MDLAEVILKWELQRIKDDQEQTTTSTEVRNLMYNDWTGENLDVLVMAATFKVKNAQYGLVHEESYTSANETEFHWEANSAKKLMIKNGEFTLLLNVWYFHFSFRSRRNHPLL